MEKINFDTLYKFLVSLGIILILIPFSVFVYLCSDSFGLRISTAELETYTETAQRIILFKQSIPLLLHHELFIPFFAIFEMLGLSLIFQGLYGWTELQKMDNEIKECNLTEAQKKANKFPDKTSDDVIIHKICSNSSLPLMKEYILIERYYHYLQTTLKDCTVKRNVLVGNRTVDIIAFTNIEYGRDYLYSCKYIDNCITQNEIELYWNEMSQPRGEFATIANRRPNIVLCLIVADNVFDHISSITSNIKRRNHYSIKVVKESNLADY